MKKTLHFRHGLAAMTATIVMLFAQLLATNAHTSGISPTTAGGETSSYGIDIIGVPVTSENCNDLSVIDGVSGTVKYDPTTKTLTLENATIDAGNKDQAISNNGISNLNIQVTGTNNIKSSSAAIILLKPTTIKGDGTLNTASTTDCGLYITSSSLTIEDCTVNATGLWGIAGSNGGSSERGVTIRNAIVTAKGSYGSICDIDRLTLDNVAITSPKGAAYDSSLKCVALNGKVVTDIVAILPLTYGIKIAGAQVTHENYNNLSVINGVSGTVRFDPFTKTLTLINATIDAGSRGYAIDNLNPDLKIQVIGTNVVKSSQAAIVLNKPITIQGDGTLNVTSTVDCGIYINNSSLTIENCTVNTTGKWGISGNTNSTRDIVTIRDATVTAQGSSGSICDIVKLTLDDVVITSPEGAAFDNTKKCVTLNGTMVTDKIYILPSKCRIAIAGTPVTLDNCNDLSGINGVSGTIYYDPATKTLTLENATIDAGTRAPAIRHAIRDLTILLKGSNNIMGTGSTPTLEISTSTTIKGFGSLNIASANECGIYITSSTLTIEDCTMNITARWGIAGPTGGNPRENVVIRNAVVSAQGSDGSICDIARLTLDRVAILSPAGAAFDSSLKCVALNGVVVTDRVVIDAISYGLQIAGVDITSKNYDKINTIDGVSGTVYYDHLTNTLTLNNATIDANANQGIYYNATPDFTIEVFGTNNIKSSRAAIFLLKPTTIKGDGTLNTTSADGCGIYVIKSALTIKDCTVNAIGNWGIAGQSGATNETVTIRNATVTAQGKDGSICDIANLTLLETAILAPDGAAYDSSRKCVALNGKRVTDKVVIHPFTCGIEIAGTPVTLDNCNDLSVIDGVSGTVKYDPVTKTLLLHKAKINLSGHISGINNKDVSDLTIKVLDGTITVGYKAGIVINKPTKIKGYAGCVLEITSIGDCGIYMHNSPLTIEDGIVRTKGKYGIAGYDGSDREILTIRSAGVRAEGRDGTICDIKNLVLEQGCSILPMGVAYDSILQCMAYNGTPYKEPVTIHIEDYNINIAGVSITSGNYDRINTIEGVSGTVTYDPTTKTLKLENATIQGNEFFQNVIEHVIPNLTILVTGTNNITGCERSIFVTHPTTIKGEGILNITPTSRRPTSETHAIYLHRANLTIEDCTVNVTGSFGIGSFTPGSSAPEGTNILTIKNAIFTGNCDVAAIGWIRNLILSGSTFTSPVYATFNPSQGAVTSEGKPVKNLVIQPTTLYDVVLDWHGENKADIIKVLTDEYGYSIPAAKAIVESTPAIVGKRMQKLDAIKMRDALMVAGGIHSSATIHPEGTWTSINSTETVVPTHRPGIYNMQGVKMTRDWEALPSGLYIVDGVKRMKK